MIKKAVFSYLNPDESFDNKAGFQYFSDFLFTTALAIVTAKRYFEKVEMVTSEWGVRLFLDAGIPPIYMNSKLESIKHISPYFWAYGKLVAYQQDEPFIHIDNDIFLWEPLPERVLNARLCFQSKEPFEKPGYGWYNVLKRCWKRAPVRPDIIVKNEVFDYAYNCGICGGHDLDHFAQWIKCSEQYIFAKENHRGFFHEFKNILIHQNLFHEQYFNASLIKAKKLRDEVEILHDDAKQIQDVLKFTHLWGLTKKNQDMMKRVRDRLLAEDEQTYDNVYHFIRTNKIK